MKHTDIEKIIISVKNAAAEVAEVIIEKTEEFLKDNDGRNSLAFLDAVYCAIIYNYARGLSQSDPDFNIDELFAGFSKAIRLGANSIKSEAH